MQQQNLYNAKGVCVYTTLVRSSGVLVGLAGELGALGGRSLHEL